MGKELTELREKAAAADAMCTEVLGALRDATTSVHSLTLLAMDLQREAADCEFEELAPAVRAHLDGRLLQRTGYVTVRATELGRKLRDLAQGVRDLQGDCTQLVVLVPTTPEVP